MRPEEHLDRFIEQRKNGEKKPLFLDEETVALLTAAERFAQLRQIEVPSQFARRLEGEIRTRTRAQKSSEQQQSGKIIPFSPNQGPIRPARSLSRRAWVATIVCIALLLIVCTSLLTISIHNLPGNPATNPNSTATQATNNATNSTQNSADTSIQQLHSSIIDLSTVVNEGRDDNIIRQALDNVSSWTNTSKEQVAALPTSSELPTIQQNLAREITEEEQTLHLLLKQVDWSIKLAFTHQLGIVGEPVPTTTTVTVHVESSGALLVMLSGTHFSSQVRLTVDGKPAGNISQSSEKKLVAILDNAERFLGTHTIGVLNPDGTAAQTTFKLSGNVNGASTPTPTPTHHPDE